MSWDYWMNVIATNKAVGNSMATAIGSEPDDNKTFDKGTPLRLIGGQNTVAWCADTCMTATGFALVSEFLGDGPYPLLNARGKTDQQIQAAKPYLIIEVGPRSECQGRWAAFASEHGYEVVPE